MSTKLSIIRSDILFDKEITFTDLKVYATICMHTNTETEQAFPHQKTIASKLNTSVPAVSRSIKILQQKGYILVRPKLNSNGRKIQNIYTIKYDISCLGDPLINNDKSVKSGIITDDNNGITTSDNSYNNINSLNSLTPLTYSKKTVKKDSENDYLDLPEWNNFLSSEKEVVLWYIQERKKDHKASVRNTPRAIKYILDEISELKKYGLSVAEICQARDKNGCVYQTIRQHYYTAQIRARNGSNNQKNGSTYSNTENIAQKPALSASKDDQGYFIRDLNNEIAFCVGFEWCIPYREKYSKEPDKCNILGLYDILKDDKEHDLTLMKQEVKDIYNSKNYSDFIEQLPEKAKAWFHDLINLLA